jgi:hypothetical protein
MAKAWQMLEREKRGEPWRFVAHGARWHEHEREQMEALAESIRGKGRLVRLLPL